MTAMHAPARVAWVTGGSSGLGAAICTELAACGWHVLAASRRAMAPPVEHGCTGLVEPVMLDVCRPGSIADRARELAHRGLSPELLVNNAGINIGGIFEEVSARQGRAIIDTNLHCVADTIRAFLPAMRERRRGTILTIGSLAGLLAPPGEAYYAASKHALEGLHEALRHELHRFGADARWLPWLKAVLPEGAFAAGLRRRFGV